MQLYVKSQGQEHDVRDCCCSACKYRGRFLFGLWTMPPSSVISQHPASRPPCVRFMPLSQSPWQSRKVSLHALAVAWMSASSRFGCLQGSWTFCRTSATFFGEAARMPPPIVRETNLGSYLMPFPSALRHSISRLIEASLSLFPQFVFPTLPTLSPQRLIHIREGPNIGSRAQVVCVLG